MCNYRRQTSFAAVEINRKRPVPFCLGRPLASNTLLKNQLPRWNNIGCQVGAEGGGFDENFRTGLNHIHIEQFKLVYFIRFNLKISIAGVNIRFEAGEKFILTAGPCDVYFNAGYACSQSITDVNS